MRNVLEQPGSVLAGDYYEAATAAFDQMLAGEKQAKDMIIALTVAGAKNGNGGVLMGPPGTGKSLFMDHCHEIIDGYGQDQVAEVPHRADLTGAQLIGEYTELEKTEIKDGRSVNSVLKANVKPILDQGKKVVKFDEINRTSPMALNAALGILQNGGIRIYEKGVPVQLSEFDLVIAGMNNYGSRHTFSTDPALASRFAMGSFMGVRERGSLSDAGKEIIKRDNFSNQAVNTGFGSDHLQKMREAIPNVMLNEENRKLIGVIGAHALDAMEDRGLIMGDGRFLAQIKSMSRTFALLTRKESVKPVDVLTSYSYALTAKLGAMQETPREVAKTIEEVFSKAAA